jgi:hypothetical protein
VHNGFGDDFDSSGIYPGWLNYAMRIKSIAEYGDDWLPPVVALTPDMAFMYPPAITNRQNEITSDVNS